MLAHNKNIIPYFYLRFKKKQDTVEYLSLLNSLLFDFFHKIPFFAVSGMFSIIRQTAKHQNYFIIGIMHYQQWTRKK